MAGIKEIRTKIGSVQNTRKITKAMEMVAASKMRKAQDRMHAGRPYTQKVRDIARHMMLTTADYSHPYLEERTEVKNIGLVLITSDKGLCGGLNTNITRLTLSRIQEFKSQGIGVQATALGTKGLAFLNRLGANIVSQQTQLGDIPNMESLIGALKVQFDDYKEGKIDAIYVATTVFVNTMQQTPSFIRLLPLPSNLEDPYTTSNLKQDEEDTGLSSYGWDYIFEPDAKSVIDDLLHRYVESLVYQLVAENMASEQSARMVAMKAASDNAKKVIGELQLVYNKTRQAAITTEISEIVGGAAAV